MRGNGVSSSTPRHSFQMRAMIRSTSANSSSTVGKRHLDVELGELLEPVGAQVLVPEAAGDLVVALESRDHEQLLVDLRALRQREEPPGLQPCRDQEVARAFGRRLAHDRRLDVDETGGLHLLPDDRDRLRAHPDVALEPLAAQVEPAVADPQRLVDSLLVELERQRCRAADHLEHDSTCTSISPVAMPRVHGLGASAARPRRGPARRTRCAGRAPRRRRRRDRSGLITSCSDAALVTQVDEDQPPMVAAARDPARERDGPPHVVGRELASDRVTPRHGVMRVATTSSRPNRALVSAAAPDRGLLAARITTVCARVRPACVIWPLKERPA